MEIKIELPELKDFKDINLLAKQVHELHVKWRPDLFFMIEELISEEKLKELIENNEIFIAKLQEKIVGYITLNIVEKNTPGMRYRKQLSIDAICVDEENRGKGIGTALLKYVKEYGKLNNCTDIYLTVNEENEDAIKIYEKFGMKVKSIAYSMQI